MKKWILNIMLAFATALCLTGCDPDTTTTVQTTDESPGISLTYTADFYDNSGGRWLSVEGKSFSISPNKIKTYSWDSDGSWISSYEMSSVMSIEIDGNRIESCGSTVIFADSRLEKCDIDFLRKSAPMRQETQVRIPLYHSQQISELMTGTEYSGGGWVRRI